MSFIYDLTATWNAIGTTFNGIKLNASNGAGGAAVAATASRLINLQNNGGNRFSVDLDGIPYFGPNNIIPLLNNPLSITGAATIDSTWGSKAVICTNGFYTLTLPAATGIPYFSTVIINPASETRAKRIVSPAGMDTFFLWPGQLVCIYSLNASGWGRYPDFQRYRLPSGTTNFNCDFVNGSNSDSDGLGTGTGAWKDVFSSLLNILKYIDQQTNQLVLNGTVGTIDTVNVHFSPHGQAVSSQGSTAITFNGNGMTLRPTSGGCFELYYDAILRVRNTVLDSRGTSHLSLNEGGGIYLLDGNSFEGNLAAGGADISLRRNGWIEISNDYTINGTGRTYHINNQGGIVSTSGAVSSSLTADQNLTNWYLGAFAGVGLTNNITWNLNGHTVTATNRYNVSANAVLFFGGSTIPGTGAGTTSTGGQAI